MFSVEIGELGSVGRGRVLLGSFSCRLWGGLGDRGLG